MPFPLKVSPKGDLTGNCSIAEEFIKDGVYIIFLNFGPIPKTLKF